MIPGTHLGVIIVGLADQALKSGSVAIHIYGAIPIIVDVDQVAAAGTNGPWYGTVTNLVSTTTSTCSGTSNTGSSLLNVSPFR